MVHFAAFYLCDVAKGWYKTMRLVGPTRSPLLAWYEFVKLFLAYFLPQSVRDSRARDFETLVQTEQMSVMEYNIQFM